MSYARVPSFGDARSLRARRGVGDDAPVLPGLPIGQRFKLPAGIDPVQYLVGQVNRFIGPFTSPDAKFEMAVDQYPMPEPGKLELGPALLAVIINQKRAADAFSVIGGGGAALSHANDGFADPIAFVLANIDELNGVLTLYGDMHHAPAARGVPGSGSVLGSPMVLIAVAAVAAIVLIGRRKAR